MGRTTFKQAVLLSLVAICSAQNCRNQEDYTRRECHPWDGGSQSACESRNCVWCDQNPPRAFCFMDEEVCPSNILEGSRPDCYPEGGSTRSLCNARGCLWCPTATGGIPWCFNDTNVEQGGPRCPAFPEADRVDCWPSEPRGMTITEEICVNKGCYYCSAIPAGVPYCFASEYMGYKIVGAPQATAKGWRVDLTRVNFPSWYGEEIQTIALEAEFQENERLRIKIFDPTSSRFEVPLNIPSPATAAPSPLYDVTFSDTPAFNFRVTRVSNGETLFDTSLGGLQFEDQFIQLAARLPSSNVYGFGETEHRTLRHDMNWRKWGMWTRDEPPNDGSNNYGVHPYMTALDSQNNMFGLLILNSNAQEVVMTPAPGMVYKTSGGILDLYFFLGPSPEQVVSQYTLAIGRPAIPPYWMLGFQLSRYQYDTLGNMKAAVDRMRQYDIPHDVLHGDIDTFRDTLSFTYDEINFAGLPEYIRHLKAEGTRYITILNPFISSEQPPGTYPPFDRGNQDDVWVKTSDGFTNAESTCWPGQVYYSDHSKQSTVDWWRDECVRLHETIEFDGLWIDMNEPASFQPYGSLTGCLNTKLNYPLHKPDSIWGTDLFEKTLCPAFKQTGGDHYDVHSLYGWYTAESSLLAAQASTGTRSYTVIRSSFPGFGRFAGHWLGDNSADWSRLKYSIIGSLEFNMFGIPYVGADICGYFGTNIDSAMCGRWMQLGSFYTFARNHAGQADHDPGMWPDVAAISRDVLHIRYTLLPYLYTLFYESYTQGSTVMRPVLHEFPNDPQTLDLDKQFLWGPAFLITPVLLQFATTVTGYFPDARWYSYYDGVELNVRGGSTTLSAPVEFIPLHFRGGYVIPTQQPANTTVTSRTLPMGLRVCLDDAGSASGSLFWDDGESLDTYENGLYFLASYSASAATLTASIVNDGYLTMDPLTYDNIQVYGVINPVTSVTVAGSDWQDYTYSDVTKVLSINNLAESVRSAFTVTW